MQRKNLKGVEGGVVRRSKARGMGRGGTQARCRGPVGVEQAQLQEYDAAHGSMLPRVPGTGKSLNNYSMLRKYCTYVCRSSQTYVRTYVHARVLTACVHACVCDVNTRKYVLTVRTYAHMYLYVCMYVQTYVRTYVPAYVRT